MEHDYLRRLDASFYQGEAIVHWSHTIEGRKRGWLNEPLHGYPRELLFEVAENFEVETLAYVLMPDHFHLLWRGMSESSDQKRASPWLRRRVNRLLAELDFSLQKQAHDHLLRPHERDRFALEKVAHYILTNPERADFGDAWPYRGSVLARRGESGWQGEIPESFWDNM